MFSLSFIDKKADIALKSEVKHGYVYLPDQCKLGQRELQQPHQDYRDRKAQARMLSAKAGSRRGKNEYIGALKITGVIKGKESERERERARKR